MTTDYKLQYQRARVIGRALQQPFAIDFRSGAGFRVQLPEVPLRSTHCKVIVAAPLIIAPYGECIAKPDAEPHALAGIVRAGKRRHNSQHLRDFADYWRDPPSDHGSEGLQRFSR